jgi:hypothetical protein
MKRTKTNPEDKILNVENPKEFPHLWRSVLFAFQDKKDNVPLRAWAALLAIPLKDWCSPNIGFLSPVHSTLLTLHSSLP